MRVTDLPLFFIKLLTCQIVVNNAVVDNGTKICVVAVTSNNMVIRDQRFIATM